MLPLCGRIFEMAYDSKTSADLEREVQEQRTRVEQRIGEIKDRLSPGQLLDEALSYTKHGGAHFAANLGEQVAANPIPAALVGVGLAWLMSSNMRGNAVSPAWESRNDDHPYPYANIRSGGLRRVGHTADDTGQWWSEFESEGGLRYKAKSNELGERAGHFVDETGKMYAGFIDEAGNRVHQFQDEAGNALKGAQGWANHAWQEARRNLGGALDGAGAAVLGTASSAISGARDLGGITQAQANQLSRQIVNLFDQQPLVAGALAFAAGAALGAALPATAAEDELVGEEADRIRKQAGKTAGKLYEKGKEKVGELYDEATETAAEVYGGAKDRLRDALPGSSGMQSQVKH